MARRICAILILLLILAITVPVLGKNYMLHSPKLWSPQEKEQYEKENPSVVNDKNSVENDKQKEQLKRDKELADKQKEQLIRDKELADKQKEQLKRDKELAEKRKEQLKKDKELVEKQKKQVKKDRELAEKQKELVKRDKEFIEKQREQFKKDRELAEKQTEQVRKEKEQVAKLREQVKLDREKIKKEKDLVEQEMARIRKDQIFIKDGISYREVTVQKGDTIYSIIRKYSNQGASYAATLRFNNIRNPNQIVSGDIIKVPLILEKKEKQQPSVTQAATIDPSGVKPPDAGKNKNRIEQEPNLLTQSAIKEAVLPVPAQVTPAPTKDGIPQQQSLSNNSTSGQKLFEQAVKSYRSGDCQTSIQLFGRFLTENTASALAADASLFVADCYLKLSTK